MISNWLIIILAAIFISAVLTAFFIPQVLDVAYKKKLFDNSDFRKIHKGVIPRLGGVAFLPALICSLSLVTGFVVYFDPSLILSAGLKAELPQLMVLFASVTLLYFIGLKDDMVDVNYKAKFIVQGISVLLTVFSGMCIFDLNGLFGIDMLSPVAAFLVSFFVIITIINAINLVDGIDGLASGIGILTLILYGFVFFSVGEFIYAMISWASMATLSVFFLFNFFGSEKKKRKIFMGDIGAMTMGMVIAFLSVGMTEINTENISNFNPVVIAFSPLVIPIFDVFRLFILRISQKRSPFLPDKCHLHHKIMESGLNQHQTLFLILSLQIFLTLINIWFSPIININIILAIDVLFFIMFVGMVSKRAKAVLNRNC